MLCQVKQHAWAANCAVDGVDLYAFRTPWRLVGQQKVDVVMQHGRCFRTIASLSLMGTVMSITLGTKGRGMVGVIVAVENESAFSLVYFSFPRSSGPHSPTGCIIHKTGTFGSWQLRFAPRGDRALALHNSTLLLFDTSVPFPLLLLPGLTNVLCAEFTRLGQLLYATDSDAFVLRVCENVDTLQGKETKFEKAVTKLALSRYHDDIAVILDDGALWAQRRGGEFREVDTGGSRAVAVAFSQWGDIVWACDLNLHIPTKTIERSDITEVICNGGDDVCVLTRQGAAFYNAATAKLLYEKTCTNLHLLEGGTVLLEDLYKLRVLSPAALVADPDKRPTPWSSLGAKIGVERLARMEDGKSMMVAVSMRRENTPEPMMVGIYDAGGVRHSMAGTLLDSRGRRGCVLTTTGHLHIFELGVEPEPECTELVSVCTELKTRFNVLKPCLVPFTAAAFSSNGSHLLAGFEDGSVLRLELSTSKALYLRSGLDAVCTIVGFADAFLIIGEAGFVLCSQAEPRRTATLHAKAWQCLDVSRNEADDTGGNIGSPDRVAVAMGNGTIRISSSPECHGLVLCSKRGDPSNGNWDVLWGLPNPRKLLFCSKGKSKTLLCYNLFSICVLDVETKCQVLRLDVPGVGGAFQFSAFFDLSGNLQVRPYGQKEWERYRLRHLALAETTLLALKRASKDPKRHISDDLPRPRLGFLVLIPPKIVEELILKRFLFEICRPQEICPCCGFTAATPLVEGNMC